MRRPSPFFHPLPPPTHYLLPRGHTRAWTQTKNARHPSQGRKRDRPPDGRRCFRWREGWTTEGRRGTTACCTAGRRLRAAPFAPLANQLSGVRDAGGSGPTTCAHGVLPGPSPQTGTRLASSLTPQVPHSLPSWPRAVVAAAAQPFSASPALGSRYPPSLYISLVIRIHTCKDGGRGTARVATPCPQRPPLPRRHPRRPALRTAARRRHASITVGTPAAAVVAKACVIA